MNTERTFTIREIFEVEPELLCMDREIRNMPLKKRSNHDRWWYGAYGLKGRMNRFVGWHARENELRTIQAHWISYEHFYDLLHKRCWNPNKDLTSFKTKHFDPADLHEPMTFFSADELMTDLYNVNRG